MTDTYTAEAGGTQLVHAPISASPSNTTRSFPPRPPIIMPSPMFIGVYVRAWLGESVTSEDIRETVERAAVRAPVETIDRFRSRACVCCVRCGEALFGQCVVVNEIIQTTYRGKDDASETYFDEYACVVCARKIVAKRCKKERAARRRGWRKRARVPRATSLAA